MPFNGEEDEEMLTGIVLVFVGAVGLAAFVALSILFWPAKASVGQEDGGTEDGVPELVDPLTGFTLDERRATIVELSVPGAVERCLGLWVNQSTCDTLDQVGLVGFAGALRGLETSGAVCRVREADVDVDVAARRLHEMLFGGHDFDRRLHQLDVLRMRDDSGLEDGWFRDDEPTPAPVSANGDAFDGDTLRDLEAPIEPQVESGTPPVGELDVRPAGSDLMPVPEPESETPITDESENPVESEAEVPNPERVEAETLYDLIVNGNAPPTQALLAHAKELADRGIEPLATLASAGGIEVGMRDAAAERIALMAARVDAALEDEDLSARLKTASLEEGERGAANLNLVVDPASLSWVGTTPIPTPIPPDDFDPADILKRG